MKWLRILQVKFSFVTTILVPFIHTSDWHLLSFDQVKPNQISFSKGQLVISVNDSASPLLYRFSNPIVVENVAVQGMGSGFPKLDPNKKEGEAGNDDFLLRLGLILQGKEKPSWVEKLFLPSWLKQVMAFSIKGEGFDKVEFLVISQRNKEGEIRKHPSSKYLIEETILQMKKPGDFSFKKKFSTPKTVLGLWIQSDGDDTHSKFDLRLREIIFH